MKQTYLIFRGDEYLGSQLAGTPERAAFLFASKRNLAAKVLKAMDYNTGTDKLMAARTNAATVAAG